MSDVVIPATTTSQIKYNIRRLVNYWLQHYIQYITNIPHSVLTRDVNSHSTLWHPYTDDHRGQLIADVISDSDHITLNTNKPNRVSNPTLQQTATPDITMMSNTLYGMCRSWSSMISCRRCHTLRMDLLRPL